MTGRTTDSQSVRRQLLAGILVEDQTMSLAGVDTAVLMGGQGQPIVLLHGPGEFAATFLPVLDQLLFTHRVIVPDLPGHGASEIPEAVDATWVEDWLDALLDATCSEPPVLVGRVVGGAIAARYTAVRPGRVRHLALVDTSGLAPFRPDPRFGLAMHRFMAGPTIDTYDRFMDFCAFDLDTARARLGARWAPFSEYAVLLAHDSRAQSAIGSFFELFAEAAIPSDLLSRIEAPTTLIWGRHDLATPLRVAQDASERYGWPLHVVEDAGDDPGLDQPEAFVRALDAALAAPVGASS